MSDRRAKTEKENIIKINEYIKLVCLNFQNYQKQLGIYNFVCRLIGHSCNMIKAIDQPRFMIRVWFGLAILNMLRIIRHTCRFLRCLVTRFGGCGVVYPGQEVTRSVKLGIRFIRLANKSEIINT